MSRHTVVSLFPDLIADKYAGPLPLSVQTGTNADLIHQFRDIYFPDGRKIVDLTYGDAGGWWKRHRPDGLVVSEHDFTALPYSGGEFGTVCYDPPYVEPGGPNSVTVESFRERFGIGADLYVNTIAKDPTESRHLNTLRMILAGAAEAARCTDRYDGFCVVKCMDFVSGAAFRPWTYDVVTHLRSLGMTLHDELVHNSGTGPGGHNIETPKRARRAHSKMLVFTWKPR